MTWLTRPPIRRLGAAASLMGVVACTNSDGATAPLNSETALMAPRLTAAPGTVSALLGRSGISHPFKVKRKTGKWEIDIQAKDPVDIVVATLTIQPGGHTGWHTHPGPGFVQVTSGTASFYEADDPTCSPTVVGTGQAWLDRGETSHVATNETDSPVTLLVTLMIPPGTNPRIDEPQPGNCSF